MKRYFGTFANLCSAMASLSIATVTLAQIKPAPPIGSLIPTKPIVFAAKSKEAIVKAFADCVYQANPTRADYFLRHSDWNSWDSTGQMKVMNRFLPVERCLGDQTDAFAESQMAFKLANLRGLLAERAYLATYSVLPVSVLSLIPRVYYSTGDSLLGAQAQGDFADCMVARDGKTSDKILRTSVGSVEETKVARDLAPSLGPCLIAGQSFSFTPASIRLFAADGLWQRYNASRPATEGVGR